ncbi:NAD(P)-dependent dehydrogenase, short-chain alcohol dehydrogenase family [Shimia gijangensis]|uniref:NAD(P)-dependent dehydrogenase, short-chain alcohol dehydrogenase family n=1 Tax=Shimia gijangensis TaxID=1470563 RepID=A0A1M6Q0V8_9RHOB|nr:SDR family NAD(P)-dependent oxidoreductase [Shimia gijangensis]SHK13814.1 NAD(P)-dependent dehydrogenase, short-chain alcohol dehydrogenase family [Shimia gijangensis]
MDKRYQDQVVMITGAASGFGKMAAERFRDEGAKLALSDVSGDALRAVADALRASGTEVVADVVDVSQEAQVAAHVANAVSAFGTINVGVNNAGIGHDLAPLHLLPVEQFDQNYAVNARGVFLCMQQQLPHMLKAGQGVILNVSSAAGLTGASQLSAYAAAKHAVVGLTKAAADEYARKNIRVNAICPAFTVTPMVEEMAEQVSTRAGLSREQALGHIASRIPMGRVAQPEEIVQAMLWACAPENSFMTGQAIALDGGLTAI